VEVGVYARLRLEVQPEDLGLLLAFTHSPTDPEALSVLVVAADQFGIDTGPEDELIRTLYFFEPVQQI